MNSIGSVAAFCTTLSFLPQLIRVWQRKSAHDVSLSMFLLFSFGVACWLVYGLGIGSTPVAAANAVTLALSLAISYLRFVTTKGPDVVFISFTSSPFHDSPSPCRDPCKLELL